MKVINKSEIGMNFEEFKSINAHQENVSSLAITNNKNYLVSGSWDKTVKIWELSTGKIIRTINGHEELVDKIVIIPNDKFILSIGANSSAKLWELETGNLQFSVESNTDDAGSILISPDGKLLFNCFYDKSNKARWKRMCYVWKIPTGKLVQTIEDFPIAILSMTNNKYLVLVGSHRINKNLDEIEILFRLIMSEETSEKMKGNYRLEFWDLKSENLIKEIPIGRSPRCIVVSPDEKYFSAHYSSLLSEQVAIWDIESGESITSLEGSEKLNLVHSLFTSNHKSFISTTDENQIKIWESTTGKLVHTLKSHNDNITSIQISQDIRYLVSSSGDKTVCIWDFKSGELIQKLEGHEDFVEALAITSDMEYLVSGSYDGIIKIWKSNKK